ncbi:MAG: transcription antitermination factor NusB [Nevskiales bacterium]
MSEESRAIAARKKARRLAMQAVYQWQMADTESAPLIEQFLDDDKMEHANADYFRQVLLGVMQQVTELETAIAEAMDRPFEQLDPVERAVLNVSAYELFHCLEIPYRVVINEAVEMAKTYGATDSHRYINAVVDRLAQQARAIEIRSRSQAR